MRTRSEEEKEAEEWERINERRRRIYEELWAADEERVRRQRERDPNNNRRREEQDDQRNPFEIVNVNGVLRATQELGVRIGASPDEVKAAYKKLAMLWHPDRPGGSAEKMKEINEAKEILLAALRP